MRHVLSLFDLSTEEILRVFEIARQLKRALARGHQQPRLAGRVLALLFEKPSLRTRVSFEAGMVHLGGQALYLGRDVGWGARESTADFARVLTQFVDVIACRSKSHARVEELARHATAPVINALTDQFHPCQALADLYTLSEFREVEGLAGAKMAFIGDANNVARSLAIACARLGVRFSLAAPGPYQFDSAFMKRLDAEFPEFEITVTVDPRQAVHDADAVYTDVWASMGQEEEHAARSEAFAPYQVNQTLMATAPAHARFMHCLPARRGEEVTDSVIDSPQSAVVRQAGNRMHVQKGLLVWLLENA